MKNTNTHKLLAGIAALLVIGLCLSFCAKPANAQVTGTPTSGKKAPAVACVTWAIGKCNCVTVMVSGRPTLFCRWI